METVIARLHKLIAHEKSARSLGSIEEAESFAAKIQAMLFQHKIEMAEIEFAAQEKDEPILSQFVFERHLTGSMSFRKKNWLQILVEAVTRANFCRAILCAPTRTNDIYIVGRAADRTAALAMIRYLYDACLECAEVQTKAHKVDRDNYLDSKRRYRNGFKVGFACAIGERLKVEKEKLVAGVNEQALIRLDGIEKAVDDAFHAEFPDTKPGREIHVSSSQGFWAGKTYGEKIGINNTKRLTQ